MPSAKPLQVGVIVEITREFGRGLCRGISELARETGLFCPHLVDAAALRDPDGLRAFDGFIARVMNDRIAATLAATGKPIVDVYYEKPRDGFAIVKTRHSRIGTLAAEHFLERRFKNFAFCGFAGGRFSSYCRAAFTRALARHGATCMSYDPDPKARYAFNTQVLINEQLRPAPDASALARWIRRLPKPIAVFCPNDLRAWQVVQICKQRGVDVPRELAVLGLDNDVLVCGLSTPMISSIDPDTEAIGRCAADTLLRLVADPRLAQGRLVRQVDPIRVVARTSTEVYPVDPPWLSDALVFISRNIAGGISASDIYQAVGRSHTQVGKVFRVKLGTSVQGEIARMRLEHAQRLLSATRLSIAEIAPRCGFSAPQYLIRTFTKAFGTSPTAWRAAQPPSRSRPARDAFPPYLSASRT